MRLPSSFKHTYKSTNLCVHSVIVHYKAQTSQFRSRITFSLALLKNGKIFCLSPNLIHVNTSLGSLASNWVLKYYLLLVYTINIWELKLIFCFNFKMIFDVKYDFKYVLITNWNCNTANKNAFVWNLQKHQNGVHLGVNCT